MSNQKVRSMNQAEFDNYTADQRAAIRLEQMQASRWFTAEVFGAGTILGSTVVASLIALLGTCTSADKAAESARTVEQKRGEIAASVEERRALSAKTVAQEQTRSALIAKGLDAADLTRSAAYITWLQAQGLIPPP